MRSALACLAGMIVLFVALAARADEIDKKYPLGDQLRVLADDVKSPAYRKLVIEDMLVTELDAEWQRVETTDNAESFLKEHGGRKKVLADSELKAAYERRVEIRNKFLDLMREGYRRFNKPAPFDAGEKAEKAGTLTRNVGDAPLRLTVLMPAPGAENHWPRFRGPGGQGETYTRALPTEWSADRNIVWRTSIPGDGNSSPIIWGDSVFLTSSGPNGTQRALYCLSRGDGQLLWTRTVPDHPQEQSVRPKNGFASATPATDGERVIAFFGTGGLVCYDFAGNLEWHHPTPQFHTLHGSGASPVLYKDSVILFHDENSADPLFFALDKRTGDLLWERKRDRSMGWCTPVVIRVDDHDELVVASNKKVEAYDPNTGDPLWWLSGPTFEVVPTIVVGDGLIYSASGRNGPTLGLRPGGRGDVTDTHLVWRAVRGGPHVPSPVYANGRLYTVNDTGIATCLDAETGKLLWQGRIRDRFSASPIVCDGLLYFCSETGVTYIVRAADVFEIVAQNDLGSPILASPAAVDGRLFIRTEEELVCIGSPAR